jgi:hypothetical protein
MTIEGVEHCSHHGPAAFAVDEGRPDHEPLQAVMNHDDLCYRHRPRAENREVDRCYSDGGGFLKRLLQGLDRRLGDQAIPGGIGRGPGDFADESLALPTECDHHLRVVSVHLFGDIDDDRPVALGEIGIRQLHHRDDPAIDGEAKNRLGQALHIPDDLLGCLGHPGQHVDFGDGAPFCDYTSRFNSRESTDLLFKVTKIHIRSVAAADGGGMSLKVLRWY